MLYRVAYVRLSKLTHVTFTANSDEAALEFGRKWVSGLARIQDPESTHHHGLPKFVGVTRAVSRVYGKPEVCGLCRRPVDNPCARCSPVQQPRLI